MCACHSSQLSFACCCVPESLYVFPCQWNYRPDHCIYGSNCKEAEQSGVFVLHGNRGVFHDHKQPAFRAVYEAIQKVELVKNFKYTKPCPRAYWLSAWLVQKSLRGCDSISSYKVCFSAARHTVAWKKQMQDVTLNNSVCLRNIFKESLPFSQQTIFLSLCHQ